MWFTFSGDFSTLSLYETFLHKGWELQGTFSLCLSHNCLAPLSKKKICPGRKMIPETGFYVFTSWTQRDQEQGCCGFCAADVLRVLMNQPTSNIFGILNHCKNSKKKVTWSHLLFAAIFVSGGLKRPDGCVTADPQKNNKKKVEDLFCFVFFKPSYIQMYHLLEDLLNKLLIKITSSK